MQLLHPGWADASAQQLWGSVLGFEWCVAGLRDVYGVLSVVSVCGVCVAC